MATTDLGKIGITPKGAWGGGKTYERLDAVEHLGASYLALRDTEAEPTRDSPDWMLLAEGISTEGVEGIIDTRFEGLSEVATSGAYADLSGAPTSLPASGGDADTVDTFHSSQSDVADTCVVRAADRSVRVGRIISDTPDDENPTVGQVIVTNGGDDLYRKVSLENFKTRIGVKNIRNNNTVSGGFQVTTNARYYKIFTIKTANYSPNPIIFLVTTRRHGYIKVSVSFIDSGSDPGLSHFKCQKFEITARIYIAKISAYSWGVYIDTTSGPDDWVAFAGVKLGGWGDFLFESVRVSSLPTGAIQATEVTSIP